ncbi:MAG: phage tailspike protein [Pseudomonadota bacterium]
MFQAPFVNIIDPTASRLRAVDDGFIFLGKEDTDPTIPANQIPVYYTDENGNTQQLSQPIQLNATGVPVISKSNQTIINPIFYFDVVSIVIKKKGNDGVTVYSNKSYPALNDYFTHLFSAAGFSYQGQWLPNIQIPVKADRAENYALWESGIGKIVLPIKDDAFTTGATFQEDLDNKKFSIEVIDNQISVAENIKYRTYMIGDSIRSGGRFTSTDGGQASYIVMAGKPGSILDIETATDNVTAFLSSTATLKRAGVVTSETFDPQIAKQNRDRTQSMLRDKRHSYFKFSTKGTVNILGSVHPKRDNITIEHYSGCILNGYLDDPSISDNPSAGHMIGFAHYVNPDVKPYDYTVEKPAENINYILNGEASTIYRDEHSSKHNNNVIGFTGSIGCKVHGSGGVGESDHRGVNFDYDAIDCHIDLSYIVQTSNEPVKMNGKQDQVNNTCTVKIGRCDPKWNGGLSPQLVTTSFVNTCEIEILNAQSNKTSGYGRLVYAGATDNLIVKIGNANGFSEPIYAESCKSITISALGDRGSAELINAFGILGVTGDVTESVKITGIKPTGNKVTNVLNNSGLTGAANFRVFSVQDCDFTDQPKSMKFLGSRNSNDLPQYLNYENNLMPVAGYSDIQEPNVLTNKTQNLQSDGGTTLTFNYKSPDWNYKFLTFLVSSGGSSYEKTLSIFMFVGISSLKLKMDDGSIYNVTQTSEGQVTITRESGGSNIIIAYMHN